MIAEDDHLDDVDEQLLLVDFDLERVSDSPNGRRRGVAIWSSLGAWSASFMLHGVAIAAACIMWTAVAPLKPTGGQAGISEAGSPVSGDAIADFPQLSEQETTTLPEPAAFKSRIVEGDRVESVEVPFAPQIDGPESAPAVIGLSSGGMRFPDFKRVKRSPSTENASRSDLRGVADEPAEAGRFTGAQVLGGASNGTDERGLPVPEYPASSRRRREQGLVVLSVEIGADGQIGAVKCVNDVKFARLVEAATAAVKRAHFQPATRDGMPVASVLEIPYRFVLD